MKTLIITLSLLLLASSAFAQAKDYRITDNNSVELQINADGSVNVK